MTHKFHNITVYLGSSGRGRDIFKHEALSLGRAIGGSGRHLIYGGMNAGLMGVLAHEALRSGGKVTGIVPRKIQDSERMMQDLTDTILVDELCDRKRLMFQKADALVALAGGFGTLDEVLEVLYWRALGLHTKPVIFVNTDGYYDDLIAYLRSLPDCGSDYFVSVDRADHVIDALDALSPCISTAHEEAYLPHFEDEVTRVTKQPIIIDVPTLENSYFASCALGLKQLAKHRRGIGFLNEGGVFDRLFEWLSLAQNETFITDKCLQLFSESDDEEDLRALLRTQKALEIDLHSEKWGKPIHV